MVRIAKKKDFFGEIFMVRPVATGANVGRTNDFGEISMIRLVGIGVLLDPWC